MPSSPLKDIDQDIQMYIFCMEEIKRRINVISEFLDSKATTGQPITDIEFLCLQFRKVLEFIALSSLSANREQYEKARDKFKTDWHVARIIKQVEKINPSFYPRPTRQVVDQATGRVIRTEDIDEGYLTRDEFCHVYDECSGHLHAYNPYSFQGSDLDELRARFGEWKDKIVALLNHHQVQLVDDPRQLWVLMQSKDDGKIHVAEMLRA